MSNSYCAIMTKEEVNIIKDSLKLCMDAITSKMSSVGFNSTNIFREDYDSKNYSELCSQYAKYATLSTDIEIVMNHDDEKNDEIAFNVYYATLTEEEVDTIIESFKTSLDIIEYKMSLAQFDELYYCELCDKCDKFEELLSKIEDAIGSEEI